MLHAPCAIDDAINKLIGCESLDAHFLSQLCVREHALDGDLTHSTRWKGGKEELRKYERKVNG